MLLRSLNQASNAISKAISFACFRESVPVLKCLYLPCTLKRTCQSEVRGRLNKVARPSNMKVVSGSGLTQASLVSS